MARNIFGEGEGCVCMIVKDICVHGSNLRSLHVGDLRSRHISRNRRDIATCYCRRDRGERDRSLAIRWFAISIYFKNRKYIIRGTNLVLLRNPEETADADENPPVDGAGILIVTALLVLRS